MTFEQPDIQGKSQTRLDSVSFNGAVVYMVALQLKTELHLSKMFQIRNYLQQVQQVLLMNLSEKEMLQDPINFREANKFKDLTLNGSDLFLLQIFHQLQNQNDCVSVDKTPPRMVMSTAQIINTPSKKAIFENKVKNGRVVTKVSSPVHLRKVENDVHPKDYCCSEVVFKLSHRALSDLETEVLSKGLNCLLLNYLLMKQILIRILPIFR